MIGILKRTEEKVSMRVKAVGVTFWPAILMKKAQ